MGIPNVTGYTSGSRVGTGSFTVDLPVGATHFLATVGHVGNDGQIGVPSGWTKVGQTATGAQIYKASGTPGTSWSKNSGSSSIVGLVIGFDGQFDVDGISSSGIPSLTGPSATTTEASLLLSLASTEEGVATALTPPGSPVASGTVTAIDNKATFGFAAYTRPAAGSTGTYPWTGVPAPTDWASASSVVLTSSVQAVTGSVSSTSSSTGAATLVEGGDTRNISGSASSVSSVTAAASAGPPPPAAIPGYDTDVTLAGFWSDMKSSTGNGAFNVVPVPGAKSHVVIVPGNMSPAKGGPVLVGDTGAVRIYTTGPTIPAFSGSPGAAHRAGVVVMGYAHEVAVTGVTGGAGLVAPSVTSADRTLAVQGVLVTASGAADLTFPDGEHDYEQSGTDGAATTRVALSSTFSRGDAIAAATYAVSGTVAASSTFSFVVTSTEPHPETGSRFITAREGAHLVDQFGDPIMMKAEAAWLLAAGFKNGSRTVPMDWVDRRLFFRYRCDQGFNTVQVDALSQSTVQVFDNESWATPNEAYWTRMDETVDTAAEYGFTVLLAIYPEGDAWNYGGDATQAERIDFGAFLGNRYGSKPNVVWQLGGDYDDQYWGEQDPWYNDILTGITGATGTPALLSLQNRVLRPGGGLIPSIGADDPFWDGKINMQYVYCYAACYDTVQRGRATGMPTFLGESTYEGNNDEAGPDTTDESMRRQIMWAYTSGAIGDIFGQGVVWPFSTYPTKSQKWGDYLDTPIARQHAQIRAAFEAVNFWDLVADDDFMTSGRGAKPTTGTQNGGNVDPLESTYATAARSADGSLAVVYVPTGRSFNIATNRLGQERTGYRVDPGNGDVTPLDVTSSYTNPGANSTGASDWLYFFQAEPISMEPNGPSVVMSGAEVQATWSAMIDGSEVPIISWSVMQGGVEVSLV